MEALPRLEAILQSKTIPGLDGFRMIAVMAVVLAHSGVGTLFFSARHGVAGFFVLSGFLITWLLLKEYEQSGRVSLKDFYIRRSLRIFPAYYAFIVVSLVWDLSRGNDDIREVIFPALFYLINYHNALEGHSSSSLAHLWSLAVEEQFYLIWPAIFIVIIKRGRNTAIVFLVCATVIVMIWRSFSYSILDWGESYVYNAFDTRFDNLAIGCTLAFLAERNLALRIFNKIGSQFWMPIATLILLFLSRQFPSDDYAYGPAFTLDALLLAILLIQLVRLSHSKPWSWLNNRYVVYIGVISYPIYLWHVWGFQAAKKFIFLPETAQLFGGIVISFMLAAVSYHLLEKRFLVLRRRHKHNFSKTQDQTIAEGV